MYAPMAWWYLENMPEVNVRVFVLVVLARYLILIKTAPTTDDRKVSRKTVQAHSQHHHRRSMSAIRLGCVSYGMPHGDLKFGQLGFLCENVSK